MHFFIKCGIINFVRTKNIEGECIFITKSKVKNLTKESLKLLIILLAFIGMVLIIFVVKYKKLYKVTISGEQIGYIENLEEFKNSIDKQMYNDEEKKFMAFYTIDIEPEYKSVYVDKNIETNEEDILNKIKANSTITYLAYEITLNGEAKSYVSTIEEAEEIVEEMKREINDEELEMSLGIVKKYTEDLDSFEISDKEKVEEEINEEIEKAVVIKGSTVNGVVLATNPVKGTYISSRYGDRVDRSSGHKGLDIAAPTGTTIVACGDGTVKFAGWYYGYGYLVIIDHGNGVETYYGHCSKLYVSAGDEVSAGDKIAAVGATGEATGSHLHLEVRVNGATVNPQNYLYK